MSADRVIQRAAKPTAEVFAEKKRMVLLVDHLMDSVLETRGSTSDPASRWLLSQFAGELAVLRQVVRDGGDATDLEQKLVALPHPRD